MAAEKSRFRTLKISASQTVNVDLLLMEEHPLGRGGHRVVVSYRTPQAALQDLLNTNKINEAQLLYGLSALNSGAQNDALSASEQNARSA
jgi:hypothetical protein